MSESRGGHPIQVALIVLVIAGGGWYFFKHYKVAGLDGVTVHPKEAYEDDQFVNYRDAPTSFASIRPLARDTVRAAASAENPFTLTASSPTPSEQPAAVSSARRFRKIRIASWALDGFGPTKFANPDARRALAKVIREFDIVAVQQIASVERDLIPRLVDSINQGDTRYDFVMGESSGPSGRQEQLAFIFDRRRVVVDREQTYTVEDPQEQMTYDPLVAWFRTAEPSLASAWTFSLVNVRIDLARAPSEVALLSNMLTAIRQDGRGEDDVVLAGLFQADDTYLVPSMDTTNCIASVRNHPTDIFGKYQTSNILIDAVTTSEQLGGGGVHDYLRKQGLSRAQAETITSHLPVFAEFTAIEGGRL